MIVTARNAVLPRIMSAARRIVPRTHSVLDCDLRADSVGARRGTDDAWPDGMSKVANTSFGLIAIACAVACVACNNGQGRQDAEEEDTVTSASLLQATSWTQTLSSDAGLITALEIAVDAMDRTFVLSCVGPCDAGNRLLSRIDRSGALAFSEQVTSRDGGERLDFLRISEDGRVGLAGDRVLPDGSTEFAVAVFHGDGRLEWRAHDDRPAHALDAAFGARGDVMVVGAASDGDGLGVAFGPTPRHVEWRFTTPNATFSRVRSDDRGFTSIAGTDVGNLATVWHLRGRGHLVFTYSAPDPTRSVALAVDDHGETLLASTQDRPRTLEGDTPLYLVTTKLDAVGDVVFTRFVDFGVQGSQLIDAAFGPCETVTVFGRHQGTARFGGDFQTTRYDEGGDLLWSNDDNFGFPDANPAAMALDHDGDVAEVGNVVVHVDQQSGFLVVYGADGAVQTTRFDPRGLVDVARDSTGGIVVLGTLGADAVVTREPAPTAEHRVHCEDHRPPASCSTDGGADAANAESSL